MEVVESLIGNVQEYVVTFWLAIAVYKFWVLIVKEKSFHRVQFSQIINK